MATPIMIPATSAVDATLATFRAQGCVYLLLASDRRVFALHPGQLAEALQFTRHQDPEALLLELCNPTVALHFSAWVAQRARKAN